MKKVALNNYAQAFLAATHPSPKATEGAIKRFMHEIEKRGDWPRRAQIVAAVERAWRAKHSRPLATIESARPLTAKQKTHVKHLVADRAKDIEEKINPSLVAGIRVNVNDMELDASLNHLLHKLFAR